MHYIHRLTQNQKRAAIAIFIGVPLALLIFIVWMWGYNRGIFRKVAYLYTVVASSQGIDIETPVTYSGMQIGRVKRIDLGKGESVILTLMIDGMYLDRVRTDSHAITASASMLGIKEIRIKGGSTAAPPVKTGDYIPSEDLFEMENFMDRVRPILTAAEKIVFRIESMLNTFPNERLNASVTDVSGIIHSLRMGESSVGKLLSTDKGAFYERLDLIAARTAGLAERLDESTRRLPEMMDNATEVSGNLGVSSRDWPLMHRDVDRILKNLNSLVVDLREMTPAIKKTVENLDAASGDISKATAKVPGMVEDVSKATSRVPALLDDIEITLNDTLMIVKGMKTAWPVKNMVPPDREKAPLETGARQSPYAPGGGK